MDKVIEFLSHLKFKEVVEFLVTLPEKICTDLGMTTEVKTK